MTNQKNIIIIRVKSDNWDTYMTEAAYSEARLQMSTGDYHTHKTKELKVSSKQLEDLKFHQTLNRAKTVGFVDFGTGEEGCHWFFYDGSGDCWVETDSGVNYASI